MGLLIVTQGMGMGVVGISKYIGKYKGKYIGKYLIAHKLMTEIRSSP